MALEGFKRIQDLREEEAELGDKLIALRINDRQRILDELKKEFHVFLSGEGFSVSTHGKQIRASYGDAVLTLDVPSASAAFLGAISVLKLSDSRLPRQKWVLSVDPGNVRAPRPTVAVQMLSGDEVERLQNRVDELKQGLSNFQPWEYSIRYFRENNSAGNAAAGKGAQVVTTLTEALTGILEGKA